MKYFLTLFLTLILGTSVFADEIRLLQTWFPENRVVTDIKAVEINGQTEIFASIKGQGDPGQNLHHIWAFDPLDQSQTQWDWHGSYGIASLDKMISSEGIEEIIIAPLGQGIPWNFLCLNPMDTEIEEVHNEAIYESGELFYHNGLNLAVSHSTSVTGYQLQIAVFRGENFREPLIRSLILEAGFFEPGGLYIDAKNRAVYAVNHYTDVSHDILVANIANKGQEFGLVRDRQELYAQLGNIQIVGHYAYISVFGTNPGIYVYDTHSALDPSTWTLIQRFGSRQVFYLIVVNNDIFYAESNYIAQARILENGQLEFSQKWRMPNRHAVFTTKMTHANNVIYFTSTPQSSFDATCVMALYRD